MSDAAQQRPRAAGGLFAATGPAALPARAGIVLVGRPNVGKSALFTALTRTYVTVSNYPGTTVEITEGSAAFGAERELVIDTPGAHGFIPASDDERVTRDILLERPPRAALAVCDAKNLEQAALLALELGEMEIPFALCLNMADEARERGIGVDTAKLSRRLGVEVVQTVAIRREGLSRLRAALESPRVGTAQVRYPMPIERAIEQVRPLLPEAPFAPRAMALMLLAGDDTLAEWLRRRTDDATLARIDNARQELRRHWREPVLWVINQARLETARRIAEEVTERRTVAGGAGGRVSAFLDRLTLHPVWSLPVLAGVLWIAYQFVGVFGAGTLVDLLETGLFGNWVNPWVTGIVDRFLPWAWARDLLVGDYGLFTMALTYALALILPIVSTFFIFFGALEDSGYLPRLAVLLNRSFKHLGLNGKAVLPMVLGLGCGTMATLTTRMLPTRKERLMAILLLSVGIPCSAQLTVILAMLGALSGWAVLVWIGVLIGVIVLVGTVASRLIAGKISDFIVELPPLRVPRLGNILLKVLARIEWYLKEAVPLFVLGTLILFAFDRMGFLQVLERAAEPVVTGLLGLPRESAEAFIIGFLRRDFGAAGLYRMNEAGLLDAVQVLVAAVVITLFIPCIAQFFMVVKERGLRTGLAIAAFVFTFALGAGTVLNFVLRAVGASF